MFTLRGRIVCATISILLAAYLLAAGRSWGLVLLAQPVLLTYGHFRYGPMVVAFRAYNKRDWVALRSHLCTVRHPEWLTAQNRAYYDFLTGVAAHEAQDFQTARDRLAAVEAVHLRTDNMRSVLEWHRAAAALGLEDSAAAQLHLEKARAMPHRPEVDAMLEELESRVAAG